MEAHPSNDLKRLNCLVSETDAAYHNFSLRVGLSDSSMMILYTLCVNGGRCPLKEICQNSGISKQTVNSALRKLETEGIVYLEAAGARQKTVCFTEAGKALAQKTALRMVETENAVFSSWPKEDVEAYLALMERYLRDFRKRSEEALCVP